METTPVIYRIERFGKEENAIAFFPYLRARNGFIVCYAQADQHSEGSLGFYMQTKAPRTAEQVAMVAALREEVNSVYGANPDPVKLAERVRLPHNFRAHAWVD